MSRTGAQLKKGDETTANAQAVMVLGIETLVALTQRAARLPV